MGILFAILASLLTATGNVILKKSFKDLSPAISFFIFSIFTVLLWAPLGLMMGVQFDKSLEVFIVGLISAVLGQAIYFYILEKGELSITATILSSFSIYTIVFSILFNNERPSLMALLFILLAILGTIIVSLPDKLNKNDFKKVSFIGLAVFGAMAIGASDTITKNIIDKTSVGSFLFWVSFGHLIVSFIYLKWAKQPLDDLKDIITKVKEYKYAIIGSLAVAVSTMFLFLSFNFTLASIASPIVATFPVLTVILAQIFLKEKLSPKNIFGIVLVIIAGIGISFVAG